MASDHGSTRRARRWRMAAVSTASLALALGALPMTMGSAEATQPAQRDRSSCEVTAERPREARSQGRQKYVAYPFEVECPRGYRVQVEQNLYEADDRRDQFTGGPYRYWHRFDGDRDWEESTRARLPHTERGDEEVYHVVRWREFDRRGEASRWHREKSPTTTIRHR